MAAVHGGAMRAVALCAIVGLAIVAQSPETDPTDGKPAWEFEEIADGVFFATGTGAMTTMSNSLVIVNDDHAMVVDTTVSPAAAHRLVQGIRDEVTEKPIRYVVNTHFHFDHSHGNQVFDDDVEIVGHEFVREKHTANVLEQRTHRTFKAAIPGQIERAAERLEAATVASERERLATDLRILKAHWNAIQETVVRPPNVTYNDRMTVVKGGREIQLHFVGRGHTGGDTLVFLPRERVVFTGDFFLGSPGARALPYMGDAFVNEWPASLDGLKALDFDVIVPGHGRPFGERKQIDDLQAFLRDLWSQTSSLRAEGVSAEDAVGRLDLARHVPLYGARAESVDPRAVLRIYEVLQLPHPL